MSKSDTLEAFIEKLHSEGVEAGLEDAERLRVAAAAEGAEVVDQAKETARRIVAEAETEAERMLAGTRSEIALALRDAQLELRACLERSLTVLLEKRLERHLGDEELLKDLLVEVVGAYARADADQSGQTLTVDVRPELAEALSAAVPGILGRALAENIDVEVGAGLTGAGFEYRVRDAVIEVTPESVADKLAELVAPNLRALLRSQTPEPDVAAR